MKKFAGVWTALITPFIDGQIDFSSLENLVQRQLNEKVDGFVVHGTTGESPTITATERREVFEFVRRQVPRDFPLIVGTGTNSTASTLRESLAAQDWGADGLLVVTPYYNRPPQRGLIQHFTSLADIVRIPILLYNVPARTACSLDSATVAQLSQHQWIIGIKEATGDLQFAKNLFANCRKDFVFLSGDDATADEFQQLGGHGVISVASHIIAPAMKELRTTEYRELVDLLFCESNPIPVKMALYLIGVIKSPELRLPLVKLNETWTEKLRESLKKAKFDVKN